MGFSDWAKEQLHAALPKCYLVANSDLCSSSSGLRYRRSASFSDAAKVTRLKPVPWDSLVCGTLEADGAFLKLEDGYYLPVFTQSGIRVLHEIEREEPAAKAKPKTKKTKAEATEEESLVFSGPGAFYEVMSERVAFRSGPSLGAKALGQLRKGEEVELFGWDESGLWRECVDHRLARSGFVLLDHPELGPLLRPKGEPLCIRPLSVLAVAAQEGRYEDLERFLAKEQEVDFQDPRGPAVVLALAKGQLRCCLRLLRAGAREGSSPELAMLRRCGPEELEELQQKSEEELKLWIQGALKQTAPTAPVQFAQSPSEEKPGEGEGELKATSPEREPESVKEVKEKGELYEVVYDSVWIRREPDAKAARVSKRIKGQRLQILEFDETGFWGRTVFKTSEGMDEGWMLLAHGEFGELLRPVHDDGQGFVVRPQ